IMVSEAGTPVTLAGVFSTAIDVADADTTLTGTGATLTATEQASFTGQIATFTDNNVNADPADFVATIDWGDGTSATTASVTGSGGTLTISGSHTYADEGTFTPVVTLSDPGGTTASTTATIQVADADTLTATAGTVSASEGTAFSGNVATFTDTNTATPASDFVATIIWGDGATTTTSVTGSAGSFTVPGTHTYADDGTYAVTVTIADDSPGAATATATLTATVAEVDLTGAGNSITVTERQTFSGTVATFSDPGSPDTGANFQATIIWGDGNTSTNASVSSVGGGNFVVSGSHAYSDEGTFTTTVLLTENGTTVTATATGSAVVSEGDVLTATAVSASATEGVTFSGNLATFTDTDLQAPASDFAATIVWGDGATTTGSVSGSAGSFVVQGSHVYADEGSFSAVVTIKDKQGTASATVTAAATVAEADVLTAGTATSIAATQGATFNGTVATFTDTNTAAVAGDFTATINWGDGSSSTGSVSLSNGTFTVAGTHVYTQVGTQSVSVVLADDSPGTAKATATATASVTAASLSATGVPVVVPQGTNVTSATVATFTDSGGNQPLSNYTATIDWGDGTTSAGVIAANSGGNGFTVTGSHNYFSPGDRTLKVTISTTGGTTTQAVTTATIGSATERFVAQVYLDLLKREAEPQGEQYWTNLIDSGHTRSEEVFNIERSIEYRHDVVQGIFQYYLHRAADPTALDLSSQFLLNGTPEQLSGVVVSSPEYFQNRGGGTGQGFLNALYVDALNRPADSAAVSATSGDDFSNLAIRQQVAAAIFGGSEYLSDLVNTPSPRSNNPFANQTTFGWYQAYLGRNAGSGEVSQAVNSLQHGTTDFQMVANIIGSDEFFAQFGS
ncbi:MAG TPA: DUF4214 domain-containing protein, partial [Pirellulales bacterium]